MSFVYAMNSHLGLPLKNTLTGRLFNDGVLARATASGQRWLPLSDFLLALI